MDITTAYAVSLITVFIAAFTIFYIFDSAQKTIKGCDFSQQFTICKEMFDFLGSNIILLAVLAGLLIVIPSVAYLMLSGQRI